MKEALIIGSITMVIAAVTAWSILPGRENEVKLEKKEIVRE
jgi:hypothetical protein